MDDQCYYRGNSISSSSPMTLLSGDPDISPSDTFSPRHFPLPDNSPSLFAARCFASAAYAVMRCVCVCLSVCLSRSYILSKRINVSSTFFNRRVATPVTILVFHTKRHGNIPTETPLTGASNTGGVGRNRDSEPAVNAATGRCCQYDAAGPQSRKLWHLSLVVSGGVDSGKRRRYVYD